MAEIETEYERLMKICPWRMRWEWIKMNVEEFFWKFHPHRNRWCDRCGHIIGNSNREASLHRCASAETSDPSSSENAKATVRTWANGEKPPADVEEIFQRNSAPPGKPEGSGAAGDANEAEELVRALQPVLTHGQYLLVLRLASLAHRPSAQPAAVDREREQCRLYDRLANAIGMPVLEHTTNEDIVRLAIEYVANLSTVQPDRDKR